MIIQDTWLRSLKTLYSALTERVKKGAEMFLQEIDRLLYESMIRNLYLLKQAGVR